MAQKENFMALKRALEGEPEEIQTDTLSKRRAINIVRNRVKISKIELLGVGKDIERWMRRSSTELIGKEVCKEDIDELVSIYYGTGSFDSITYTLHEDA
jgi:hypothetical protein